jgi:hypothetical protein
VNELLMRPTLNILSRGRVAWLLALALLLALLAPVTRGAQAGEQGARRAAPAPSLPATTLADYRSRMGRAVRQLEELAAFCDELERGEKYENWSSGEFDPDTALQLPGREENTMTAVRRLLPASERVSLAGSAVTADNRWVHDALGAYERDSARLDNGGRAAALRSLAGRLRALEEALAVEGNEGAAPRDKDAEKGRLATILRQPGFDKETAQGGALRRLFEDIARWIRDLLPDIGPMRPGTNARVSQATQYLVFGLCLLVLAYVGWRFWSRRPHRQPKEKRKGPRVVLGEQLAEDQTAADLLEEAERLARAGDARAAIRKAYVALLVELGDRRILRLAQHKTNRDYLQNIREAAPPRLYTEMLPLTFDYELHWYGLQPADDGDWASFRERCRSALAAT